MSQITRCPACQTQFKVVADQLRISDGWVRCGNCQQVFDASLSLQPAAPEPMLPDMRLDELRGPVGRAASAPVAARAWGVDPGPQPIAAEDAADTARPDDGFAETQPGSLYALEDGLAPVTHVPSFLKAPAPRQPSFLAAEHSELAAEAEPVSGPSVRPTQQPELLSSAKESQVGEMAWQDPWLKPRAPAPSSTPGGYVLPAAEPDEADEADSAWPALFDGAPEPASKVEASGDASELDLAHFMAEVAESTAESKEPLVDAAVSDSGGPQDVSSVDSALAPPDAAALEEDDVQPDWDLVQDRAEYVIASRIPAAESNPAPVALPALPAEAQEVESSPATFDQEDDSEPSEVELSFMRHARRRAFWSGNGVRLGLALIAFGLLIGLLAQTAFHERARLAAAWPQSRPALQWACGYLRCSVGTHRDIGAVLVDGSAFNRVQGDRYQFSLTLRNRAELAVEAPAIELTLTDAQDQTVLRRVLLPEELAAPNPLSPGQEWSTVAPMAMAQGASRVAGYRVLAFYP